MPTFALSVEIPDVPDFLRGEEDSNLIEEEVEEVGGECPGEVGVELGDKLVDVVEGLHALPVHLLLDLVEDRVGLVLPIHPKLQNYVYYFIIRMEGDISISEFNDEDDG
jgi:hypothetical protein